MAINLVDPTPSTEDFDSLANSGTSTTNPLTLNGWVIAEAGTSSRNNGQYAVDTGTSNGGDTYSYGAAGSTDRALGSLASGSLQSTFGASFTNASGGTITQLTIAYTGEQWRYGGGRTGAVDQLDFAYSLDATSLTAGSWTNVDDLDFTSVVASGPTGMALNGNDPANQRAISYTITGLTIAAGETFWIRWSDPNITGNDDGLAVDSFSIQPTIVSSFAIDDVTAAEGTGGTTAFTFTVTRSGGTTGAVDVPWTLDLNAAGTTANAADFTGATSGTLHFADGGPATQTITISVVGDAVPEANELFHVLLGAPTAGGGAIGDGDGLGMIVNDDTAAADFAIGDVTAAEGDSGTAAFTFTITRSDSSGTASVDYATMDGTATAASGDYVAASGTVSFAAGEASKTITVLVNGDRAYEGDETFSVQLSNPSSGYAFTDATGLGTITNDDTLKIHDIQGTSYFSPMLANAGITTFNTESSFTVTIQAVVTAINGTTGFFLTEETADWDANDYTSEGIFVLTGGTSAGVAVGDLVTVTAKVQEYQPFATNTPRTVLSSPTVVVDAHGATVPVLTLDASHPIPNDILTGVTPLYTDSVDDPGDSFDAANYAMSFYETVEGMLVTVPDLVVADGFVSTSGGEPYFKAYSTVHADAGEINSRGGYTMAGDPPLSPPDTANPGDDTRNGGRNITDGDVNPDILEIDFSGYATTSPYNSALLSMGDKLGTLTGIIENDFTDLKFYITDTSQAAFVDTTLTRETTTLAPNARALTFATFNVENLDPTDVTPAQTAGHTGKFYDIANVITNNLHLPDILSIEEIQDNNGAGGGDGTSSTGTDASTTWQMLVDALNTVSGAHYQWVDELPVYNAEGGEQSGNIRVGFLYNTDRVQLGDLAPDATIAERRQFTDRLGDGTRDAGDRIQFSDDMIAGVNPGDYANSRKSLLGQFSFQGNTVFALANHLPAKSGSGEFWQANQDQSAGNPINAGWDKRNAIAEDIYTLLNHIQNNSSGAKTIAGGDFNDFYYYRPLEAATGYVYANGTARSDGAKLQNLTLLLPEAERYSYTFDGRSQQIDHVLANAALGGVAQFDVVHINSGFPATDRISDHDPALASFDFSSFGEVLNGTSASETIDGLGGNDIIDGKGGADTLRGGAGDDIIYVDSLDDVVVENAGEGTHDEVRSSVAGYAIPDNVEVFTFIGTAGTGSATPITGNAGDNAVNGGVGADLFDLSQGGNDTANGGDGNDGFLFGATFDANDHVDGGTGTNDQLAVTSFTGTVTAAMVTNVEVFVAMPGGAVNITTADDLVAAGTTMTFYANNQGAGDAFTFNGAAESSGSLRVFGGGGTDHITGGSGDDQIIFGPGRFDPALDTVDGGAGADQLQLDGHYTLTLGAAVQNVEAVVLLAGPAADRGTFAITATEAFAGGQARTIDGSAVQTAVTIDGSGMASALTLIGGTAADSLTGGAGADSFRFATALGGGNVDTIANFSAAQGDRIVLDHAVFAALPTGALAASAFVNGPAAADADDRILYDSLSGALSYDADGSGAGAAVQFATIANHAELTAASFVVV